MCPGNLARQFHVVIGDVRLWVPGPVLELHFQTTAELFEIDLLPIDAEFAANSLGRGGTYPRFFVFMVAVPLKFSTYREVTRVNVEVSPRLLFIESSSWLKARMVLEVTLLFTRSSSALVIFNVMVLPLMAQVPRIVPVTPWESVLLMNPWGRNCAMKLPPPLKVIDSFMLPTVPSQLPTIFAA